MHRNESGNLRNINLMKGEGNPSPHFLSNMLCSSRLDAYAEWIRRFPRFLGKISMSGTDKARFLKKKR